MDKKINSDEKSTVNSSQEEEQKMPTIAKKEQASKELKLSSKKLNEITVRPIVKNGKLLFDKNNKDHRYIMEEES